MINFLRKIYTFFNPSLDLPEMDLNTFLGDLKSVEKYAPIDSVTKVYHIFSHPVYEQNYSILLDELATISSFGSPKIEMGDYLVVNYFELTNSKKLLKLSRYTPDFNPKSPCFFSVKDFPKFSNDRTLIYENRTYYSRIKNPPIEPVYISDEMLRKPKIL